MKRSLKLALTILVIVLAGGAARPLLRLDEPA